MFNGGPPLRLERLRGSIGELQGRFDFGGYAAAMSLGGKPAVWEAPFLSRYYGHINEMGGHTRGAIASGGGLSPSQIEVGRPWIVTFPIP